MLINDIQIIQSQEIDVDQLSEKWFELRLRRLTSSLFPKLMPSSRQKMTDWNKTQLDIIMRIASQILTGERKETFQSESMTRGITVEKEAIKAYELETMQIVRPSGFWVINDNLGDSPDGIIESSQKTVEIKCPDSHTHLKYYLNSEELLKDYKWQGVGHLWGTGFELNDFVSFDNRFEEKKQLVIRPYEYNALDMEQLQERMFLAVKKLLEFVNA